MTRVQATVSAWDPAVGGAARRDDGAEVLLPPQALAGGPFRLLHPGQRVALEVEDGRATRVDLV